VCAGGAHWEITFPSCTKTWQMLACTCKAAEETKMKWEPGLLMELLVYYLDHLKITIRGEFRVSSHFMQMALKT
jgi:hypothetical protein